MKLNTSKKNLSTGFMVCGICFLFFYINLTSATTTTNISMSRVAEGDIPTWTVGDSWTYTINPLSFSSPNGSFDGTIENFKQTVVGITDNTYSISISGDITGDVVVSGFSGELTGAITGESHIRMSDLAEETTELHSTGTIIYMWLPFPYTMDLYMSSSPALEVYDFPLQIEQWELSGLTTITGSFSIEGIIDQPFDGSQWIDETVECTSLEQLSVPAGTFECYKIGRETTLSWFSTQVGNMVKTTVEQYDENMTLQLVANLQSYTLVDQPIIVTEEIVPSVCAPGASVLITGQAITHGSGDPVQNSAITIEIPSTGGSWSTTTNSLGQYSMIITAPTITDDTACGKETGSDGVIVSCSSGGLSGYRVQSLTTIEDAAPTTPVIQGPSEGKPKVAYTYTIRSSDPENDNVFYYVLWGDGTNSSWLGPSASNENITVTHTYAKKGNYLIQVKAQDIYGAVSDWGTLPVNMPSPTSALLMKVFSRFPLLFYLLQQFFRV